MERAMSHMTQTEVAKVIADRKPVIVPTGATEAHGPHMPTDTDTHQAEQISLLLAAPDRCRGGAATRLRHL